MEPSVVLVVAAGERLCALGLDGVREIMRPQPTQPLPGGFGFVDGVAIIRGAPTPVLNLARLLGTAETSPPRRFVALRLGARSAALAVESVLGIHAFGGDALAEMPPLLRGPASEHVERLSRLDAELVFVLRAARLVPEALWAELVAGWDRS